MSDQFDSIGPGDQRWRVLYDLNIPVRIIMLSTMANGIKPVQYVAQEGKSVPTVQTQRQAVFQKADVNNQLELMHKLRDLMTSFESYRISLLNDSAEEYHIVSMIEKVSSR